MNYNFGERGDGIFKAKVSDLISVVSDHPNTEENDLQILPNPATDNLFLNNAGHTGRIEIYSTLGQKVLETEYLEQIDVSRLVPGIYFLKLNGKMYKFVKI